MKTNYYHPLHADNYYHVYNRTNNKELLFRNDNDRKLFLERLTEYILPYTDIFAYSLLGNHFHLLLRVKSLDSITEVIKDILPRNQLNFQKAFLKTSKKERSVEKILENQFSRFFSSYAKLFNSTHKREGNLFTRRFKRILIKNEFRLTSLISYIHTNCEKHNIHPDFRQYAWSSYQAILSNAPTKVNRDEVLSWFANKEDFVNFHAERRIELSELKEFLIE